jgi:hypothetical protein
MSALLGHCIVILRDKGIDQLLDPSVVFKLSVNDLSHDRAIPEQKCHLLSVNAILLLDRLPPLLLCQQVLPTRSRFPQSPQPADRPFTK